MSTAVHDADAARREQAADPLRRMGIHDAVALAGSTKDADASRPNAAHIVKYSPSLAVTLSSLVAWGVLLGARGGFWRARVDAHLERAPGDAPLDLRTLRVEVIVPARNEAETVGPAVASLVRQRFGGHLRVTLVDDHSSDATRAVALAATRTLAGRARFAVCDGRPLGTGWSGKLNALDSGLQTVLAERGAPDYWLFCDADIVHDPGNVYALVSKAERDGIALVSLMVRLRCRSFWEQLLVPAFVFFFQKLYPFAWVADPGRRTAAAAGGCVLISHDALRRAGGLAAIRGALIDDCALAAAVKATGARTWIGLTDRTCSVRAYDGLEGLWTMVKRTAFTQLGRSYAMLPVTAAGMALLYLVPPAATVGGLARGRRALALSGALAWCAMGIAYRPTTRAYRRPAWSVLTLPFAAALYTVMTFDSALAHARKRGGAWKGRVYDLGAGNGGDRSPQDAERAGRVECEANS